MSVFEKLVLEEMDEDIYFVLRHVIVNAMTDRDMDGEVFSSADSALRWNIYSQSQQARSAVQKEPLVKAPLYTLNVNNVSTYV